MLKTRDSAENILRLWNSYEVSRKSPAVIDFDCAPRASEGDPITSRLDALARLAKVRDQADDEGDPTLSRRLDADCAYAEALLGRHQPLDEYVRRTQGCATDGWSSEYIAAHGEVLRKALADAGIAWGPATSDDLSAMEGLLGPDEVADEIRSSAVEYEPRIRAAANTAAEFNLSVESVDIDAYWLCWLDGSGNNVRLRINTHHGNPVSKVRARQLALHEILGHGLQSASFAAHAEHVGWLRILAVHSPCQVLLEGLAQAMPLFIAPEDEEMALRVKYIHYAHLVRSRAHLALSHGRPPAEIAAQLEREAPFFSDRAISNLLADRGSDPLLRTYMWAYAAGIDWFIHVARADSTVQASILQNAYREPLSPAQLMALWPGGPVIGGEAKSRSDA